MDYSETSELNEMREQITLLKKKLDQENIINERLMRETIKGRAGFIINQEVISYVAAIFVIVFGSVVFKELGLSWQFIGGTCILMLIVVIFNFIIHRELHKTDFLNGDLRSAAVTMKKIKKSHMTWIMIGIPVVIVWISCLYYELITVSDSDILAPGVIGSSIGGVIGAVIGYKTYKKILRTCDEIIACIDK